VPLGGGKEPGGSAKGGDKNCEDYEEEMLQGEGGGFHVLLVGVVFIGVRSLISREREHP